VFKVFVVVVFSLVTLNR